MPAHNFFGKEYILTLTDMIQYTMSVGNENTDTHANSKWLSLFTDYVQMMIPPLIASALLVLCRRETLICHRWYYSLILGSEGNKRKREGWSDTEMKAQRHSAPQKAEPNL